MKKQKRPLRIFFVFTVIFFSMGIYAVSGKEKIVVGTAISLTGPYAPGAISIHLYNYKMWIEEVNAEGGIYLSRYDRKVPVELIVRDDESQVEKAIALLEELIEKDKVDLLLPPWGTAMQFAIAPVVTKYGYPVIGPTISSDKIQMLSVKLDYFFCILNTLGNQARAIVDVLKELKIKKVALIYTSEIHGIEWVSALAPMLVSEGIDMAILKAYRSGSKDLTSLLEMVKKANVEAILAMSYPEDTFLITQQVRELKINPELFFLTVGVAFPGFRDKFGVKTVEGIMGAGVWNPKLPYPLARTYFERYCKRWKKEPDRWASAFTFASLEVLKTAIEKAGDIDRKKIRDIIAADSFSTIIGPVKFVRGFNIYSPGEIGQWQNGEFEVIASKSKRTASPVFPKPEW